MKLVADQTFQQAEQSIPLRRRGAWLIAPAGSWQMASVEGPLELLVAAGGERQYFHVRTASKELLLVSRSRGEKGMRELRLDSILSAVEQRSA
ncbi:MAG: hypothetical protein ACXWR1_16050 [Bdellovibrionota bacterium]